MGRGKRTIPAPWMDVLMAFQLAGNIVFVAGTPDLDEFYGVNKTVIGIADAGLVDNSREYHTNLEA